MFFFLKKAQQLYIFHIQTPLEIGQSNNSINHASSILDRWKLAHLCCIKQPDLQACQQYHFGWQTTNRRTDQPLWDPCTTLWFAYIVISFLLPVCETRNHVKLEVMHFELHRIAQSEPFCWAQIIPVEGVCGTGAQAGEAGPDPCITKSLDMGSVAFTQTLLLCGM